MARIKKIRLRRYKFHPVTTFILLTIIVMIVSSILSRFNVQVTYSLIDSTGELEKNVVSQPLIAPVIVSMSRSDISFIEESFIIGLE